MDFDEAVKSHVYWKLILRWLIDGQKSPDIERTGRDDACELGAWIREEGAALAGLPEYSTLVRTHSDFHKMAAFMVAMVERGDRERALLMLEKGGEFDIASSLVVDAIRALERAAKAS